MASHPVLISGYEPLIEWSCSSQGHLHSSRFAFNASLHFIYTLRESDLVVRLPKVLPIKVLGLQFPHIDILEHPHLRILSALRHFTHSSSPKLTLTAMASSNSPCSVPLKSIKIELPHTGQNLCVFDLLPNRYSARVSKPWWKTTSWRLGYRLR